MTKKLLMVTAVAVALAGCGPDRAADDDVSLEDERGRLSYGLGYNLGERIKEDIDLDVDAFAAGVRHAVEERGRLMSDEEIMHELQDFQEREMARHEEAFHELARSNRERADAFLAENAEREGVVTTDSGLQYRVIEEGTGEIPGLTDVVEVHYRGKLIDGTEFDSSYARGEPVSFPVNGVIPGWTEALMLMPEGSHWELVLPPELAYGETGAGDVIGPNAALVFEVELLEVRAGEGND